MRVDSTGRSFFGGWRRSCWARCWLPGTYCPALLESAWVGIGADPASTGYTIHLANWRNLFVWSPIYAYPEAADPTVPLPGYLPALLVAGLLLVPLARRSGLLQPLGIGLFSTAVAIWLTTDASAFLWHATAPVLGKLQFPWRWQTIVALGAGLLAAVVLELALRAIPVKGRYRHCRSLGRLRSLAIGYVIVAGVAGLDHQESSLTDDDITRAADVGLRRRVRPGRHDVDRRVPAALGERTALGHWPRAVRRLVCGGAARRGAVCHA